MHTVRGVADLVCYEDEFMCGSYDASCLGYGEGQYAILDEGEVFGVGLEESAWW